METPTAPQPVLVMVSTEAGIFTVEGLLRGTELLLVIQWAVAPDGKTQWPTRGIHVAPWAYRPARFAGHQFQLVPKVTTALLAGREAPQAPAGALQEAMVDSLGGWSVPVRRAH